MIDSSREKLDMDLGQTNVNNNRNLNNHENGDQQQMNSTKQLTFNHNKGFYIKRWIAILSALFIISSIVAIIVLSSSLAKCNSCTYQYKSITTSVEHQHHEKHKPSTDKPEKKPFTRLSTAILPVLYDIHLKTFMEPNFYFDGHVSIQVTCEKDTNVITLNANELDIHNETVSIIKMIENKALGIKHISQDKERQIYELHLSESLVKGNEYKISISYNGTINNDLSGLYRSSYIDPKTKKQKWLAVTHFEPTDARKVFPCFDEPEFKAQFTISVTHWSNMTAISNMPIENITTHENWTTSYFQPSVRMSTYLVALSVGEFGHKIDNRQSPIFGVYTRRESIDKADYALDIGPKMLKHYEKFFNISFPLPKLDMIAVPDFQAGAMENWGLITYRETAMLYDPKTSSASNHMRVANVVAHELAHQWFGNLVTMKWWDDLWLNEGFASYVEYEGVESVHPNWKMFERFAVDEIHDVFELDCLQSSHPVSVKVEDPDEINEIFDRISYGKGATIIRMMIHMIGAKTFQKGISNYLHVLKYKNAVQDDLWYHLTAAQENTTNKVDVKKVMDSWTLQVGFPIVTFKRDYNTSLMEITQERYVLVKNNQTQSENLTWEIPITYTTSAELNWSTNTRLWLKQENSQLADVKIASNISRDDWFIANVQQVGYYRVNYDEHNWRLLIEQLQNDYSKINVINRAQMLDDLFNLARIDLVDQELALNATKYLTTEIYYVPWSAVLKNFGFIDSMLRRTPLYGAWIKYVLKLIRPTYERFGWTRVDENDILSQFLQNDMLGMACKYELSDCVSQAKRIFTEWRDSVNREKENPINPNHRRLVYCQGVKSGGEDEWDFVWRQYLKTSSASERGLFMGALACTKHPWLLNRYIEWSFNETSKIRRQDGVHVFAMIANSNYGRDLAFNYIRENWDKIYNYYGTPSLTFSKIIKSVAKKFNTEFDLNQLKEFHEMQKDKVGSSRRAFNQVIENTQANIQWMNKHYKSFEKWLNDQNL